MISAPSSSGRWKYGVSSVLSTIVSRPCGLAHVQTASISVIIISGFVGVSMKTAFVFSLRTASSASRSLVSTYEAVTPNLDIIRSSIRYVPPYRSRETMR
ncbi:hypothetical protein D3C71_1708120 [compost metagenome]